MKITKTELQKIIKEELIKEALDVKSFDELSSNDQDVRNDIEAAQQVFRKIERPGVLYRMSEDKRSRYEQAIRIEIKDIKTRLEVARRLKENKFSDVRNIKNLEGLLLHLDGLASSIREGTLRVKEEFSYDPSREDQNKR